MRIIIPKHEVRSTVPPLFFLAGPIRGGGDWQTEMCRIFLDRLADGICTIVCPCRWHWERHPLSELFQPGSEDAFSRQLDWERHYLWQAGAGDGPGCVIFWLPLESEANPHPGPEPYAMDTRGELGEWRAWMRTEGARVVVGADPRFHGLSQIQRNFTAVLGRAFPIYNTMEDTTDAAIALATR